jgi:heme/copper-type cytochrome/quinol oxidase subunit 1
MALLLLAAAIAVAQTSLITWRMDELREAGESGRSAFRTLHGVSMMLYFGTTILLAAAGALMPRMIAEDASWSAPRTDRDAASAPEPSTV